MINNYGHTDGWYGADGFLTAEGNAQTSNFRLWRTPEEQQRFDAYIAKTRAGQTNIDDAMGTGLTKAAAEKLAAQYGGLATVKTGETNGVIKTDTRSDNLYINELDKAIKTLNETVPVTTLETFKYEADKDPLYQQYSELYKRLGAEAAEDTLGRASALTQGRPSSYAVSAAAQQNNRYQQELANIIPTLENQAYNRYVDEYNRDKAAEETAYQRALKAAGQASGTSGTSVMTMTKALSEFGSGIISEDAKPYLLDYGFTDAQINGQEAYAKFLNGIQTQAVYKALIADGWTEEGIADEICEASGKTSYGDKLDALNRVRAIINGDNTYNTDAGDYTAIQFISPSSAANDINGLTLKNSRGDSVIYPWSEVSKMLESGEMKRESTYVNGEKCYRYTRVGG